VVNNGEAILNLLKKLKDKIYCTLSEMLFFYPSNGEDNISHNFPPNIEDENDIEKEPN
tara:strand:+ start:214 stop:387 length:174 start_codon:yes stop_codon:yes gene_type:complete